GAAQGRCDCSALRPVRPCGEADNTRNTHTMRAWSAGVTPMAIKRTKKADPVHVIVKVDGRRWRRVLSLSGSRSHARHYVLETRPNGPATVQFGDGAHGALASKASAFAAVEPPHDSRFSADWWKDDERRAAAQRAEQQRIADYYARTTKEQEDRENAEA